MSCNDGMSKLDELNSSLYMFTGLLGPIIPERNITKGVCISMLLSKKKLIDQGPWSHNISSTMFHQLRNIDCLLDSVWLKLYFWFCGLETAHGSSNDCKTD